MKLEREVNTNYWKFAYHNLINENLWKFLTEYYRHIHSNAFTFAHRKSLEHNRLNHIAPMFIRRQAFFP
ncbi:hypothetical protein MtrunA17_Chr1g0168961 [Medicago truncatula]|uniref:Uncharacterized protein n=1 Tax=Medicago truncatula TaxID=3880 RepID=I3SCW6_MEDTR|nr:unknown [Medicago truncatula]RHN78714.1 hypothetical protein MtrunA17_Chr1g0168961 [Medicago truncatula]